MALPTERTRDDQYVAVLKLAGHYAAIRYTKEEIIFISEHLEKEERVARIAAQSFGTKNNIFYDPQLQEMDRAVVSVLKHEGNWVPVALFSEEVTLLQSDFIIFTQREAMMIARRVALLRKLPFLPSIGIQASEVKR